MKSVVIIGKGPSVKHSNKEYIDSFDDVAIINFPPMENYQHLVSNRAKYHFLNAGDVNPKTYQREFLNNLGLTHVFNTSRDIIDSNFDGLDIENYKSKYELEDRNFQIIKPEEKQKFMPDYDTLYFFDYGAKIKKKYEEKYDIWPSSGIMAVDYFYNNDEYDKICLIGFDLYEHGKDVYYFTPDEVQPSLKRLFHDGTYSSGGKVLNHKSHGDYEIHRKILWEMNETKQILWNRW